MREEIFCNPRSVSRAMVRKSEENSEVNVERLCNK
jgi:hypothetical protein